MRILKGWYLYHGLSIGRENVVPVGNLRYGGNDLLIVSSSGKEKKTRERRSGKENKRKQGCDSVSLACASPDYCVRTPVRPSGAGTSRTGTSRIKCGHKHAFSNSSLGILSMEFSGFSYDPENTTGSHLWSLQAYDLEGRSDSLPFVLSPCLKMEAWPIPLYQNRMHWIVGVEIDRIWEHLENPNQVSQGGFLSKDSIHRASNSWPPRAGFLMIHIRVPR